MMSRLNAGILVTSATITACTLHVVVLKPTLIACRKVVFVREVSERRWQAVGTIFAQRATGLLQGVLQFHDKSSKLSPPSVKLRFFQRENTSAKRKKR